jgi:ABC-2 type transport system permease protein
VIALVRTEFTKAARRIRTLVVVVLLIGLPTLIVTAIHAHHGGADTNGGGPSEGLFRLARQSGLLVPAAVLVVMSGFLLVVIAGMFAGDSVAGDAGWGNLRYLLMRPVARGRLLVAKAFVAGTLIWGVTILAALAGLGAGIALFGVHPVALPSLTLVNNGRVLGEFGIQRLSEAALLERTAIATAYVAFGFTALLALGTLFSTLTDTAASAIGATIGVYIVSEILDAITAIGRIRYGFPTHYADAWTSMFTESRFSHEMLTGVVVQIVYFVVAGAAALVVFRRKDIRS